jgi:hypothetical protein
VPAANRKLTTPANSTPKPTSAMPATASTGCSEQRVPRVMKTPPTARRRQYERNRTLVLPGKSTKSMSENAPNAANRPTWGSEEARVAMPKAAGTTTAARSERLAAVNVGSRAISAPVARQNQPVPCSPCLAPRGFVATGRSRVSGMLGPRKCHPRPGPNYSCPHVAADPPASEVTVT